MLEIKCPYCGIRSQNEFAYGGDANLKRPKLETEISDLQISKDLIEFDKNVISISTLDKKTISDIKSKLIHYVS